MRPLGFGLTSRADYGRVRRPGLPALLHALMAGTMIWMLTAMRCCVLPVARAAIGPGPRVKDPVSASQAAMSAGMAAMLLATLG
jgi:hypothetical protein